MARKNKSILIMGILFVFLVLIDLWSTLRLDELVPHLEANLVYKYIGITGIVILNVFYIWGLSLWYIKTKRPTSRFYIIHILVLTNLTRMIVIWNNIKVEEQFSALPKEQALQLAKSVTTEMKVETIVGIAVMQLLPFLVGALTYWIYCIDHSIEFKEKPQET